LRLDDAFVEREYHLLNTMEVLRNKGFMQDMNGLILGGGHGVRAYLPEILQRYSIDLDFYSNIQDIGTMKQLLEDMGFVYKGYGATFEGKYKRFDAPLPSGFENGTVALTRNYEQHFKLTSVPPEFYVTVSNDHLTESFVMKRPKSYIPIEYVKADIPILPPEVIIASKIRALTVRSVKDVYKDLFDIHALYKNERISDKRVMHSLQQFGPKLSEYEVYEAIKCASHEDEAKRAVKIPQEGMSILKDWKNTTKLLRAKILMLLKGASCLI
jgi:predicted nucleotidyltransferase component of viral defense system